MKPSDWTEADRAVRLEEGGHEVYSAPWSDEPAATCWHCAKCAKDCYETLRECQDACLEREIEARCGDDVTP